MSDIAIRVNNISKLYHIGARSEVRGRRSDCAPTEGASSDCKSEVGGQKTEGRGRR